MWDYVADYFSAGNCCQVTNGDSRTFTPTQEIVLAHKPCKTTNCCFYATRIKQKR